MPPHCRAAAGRAAAIPSRRPRRCAGVSHAAGHHHPRNFPAALATVSELAAAEPATIKHTAVITAAEAVTAAPHSSPPASPPPSPPPRRTASPRPSPIPWVGLGGATGHGVDMWMGACGGVRYGAKSVLGPARAFSRMRSHSKLRVVRRTGRVCAVRCARARCRQGWRCGTTCAAWMDRCLTMCEVHIRTTLLYLRECAH